MEKRQKHYLILILPLITYYTMVFFITKSFNSYVLNLLYFIPIVLGIALYLELFHCNYKTEYVENEFFNKKLLVFAPHPDDELNTSGVLIRNVILSGGTVYVLITTNFDVYGESDALKRLDEAKKLYMKLGIPLENIFFTGFPATNPYKKNKNNFSYNKTKALTGVETYSYTMYKEERNINETELKKIIIDIICKLKPDIICGVDYDSHVDHRLLSLILDQAVEYIIEMDNFYKPFVLKGYSYATAWMSNRDFYSEEVIRKSEFSNNNSSILFPYIWEDRIRIPYIKAGDLGYCLRSCLFYNLYSNYSSQNALSHMNQLINSDQIFWKLETDNIFLGGGGGTFFVWRSSEFIFNCCEEF